MKPLAGILLLSLVAIQALIAQDAATRGADALIPKPVSCIDKTGVFILDPGTPVVAPTAFREAGQLLAEQLRLSGQKKPGKKLEKAIVFEQASPQDHLQAEGYKLHITPTRITLTAQALPGAMHAAFTLIQLQQLQPDLSKIPCAEITDYPRFRYRGMHLDVSRHFFPVSFIKKYIDLMAMYKYNTFHWHLTDGPGWRLEIKQYPLLNQVAAFRTHSDWKSWWKTGRRYSNAGAPNAYGGFYTQEEAREIVAYAARRGITVIPEIEMPGHSEEVLAVYPELSCSGQPYKNGEFCIGNDATVTFLQNVLSEVIDIFPSTYIHVGGDEAGTKAWAQCDKCQLRKKQEGLNTEHELQAYLIKRMEHFLKSRGRKLLGWDEILDGGLPPDATVMSWRGEKGGIEAARQGHDVVMTPGETYLDAYQSDPTTQPEAIGGFLPLQRVYNYEPIPAVLNAEQAKHILGVQANLWTEYMPTTYQVEYMAYPRAVALAEVAWTQPDKRQFDDFHRRLQAHYLLLQRQAVNYYRPSSFLAVYAQPDYERQVNLVSFTSEQFQPEIRYTTDGSAPTAASSLYDSSFPVAGQTEIKAAIFKNGQPQGNLTVYTANYHKAIGKKVQYNQRWSDSYPAQQEATLTNGVRGSITYSDKQWLGYLKDFDVTIDMESVQPIASVAVQFMHQPGPGVFLPSYVEVQFSEDGVHFTPFPRMTHDVASDNPKLLFKTFALDSGNVGARYIRVIAPNVMGGFMFVDEIVVY